MPTTNIRTAAEAAEYLSQTTGLSWRSYDWAPCQIMSRIPDRDIRLEITVGLASGIHAWSAHRTINEGLHSADLAGNENDLDMAAEQAIAAAGILQAQTRQAAGLVWYPTRTRHGWGEPGFVAAISPTASAEVNVWYERWEWRLDLPRPLYDALEATGVVDEIRSPRGSEDTFEQAVAAALAAPAILAERLQDLAQAFATAVATLPCAPIFYEEFEAKAAGGGGGGGTGDYSDASALATYTYQTRVALFGEDLPEVAPSRGLILFPSTDKAHEPQTSTLHGPVPHSEMSACFQALRRSPGLRAIAIERARQIDAEGYTADHDAEHGALQLLQAGAAYNWTAVGWPESTARSGHWPWRADEFKPTTPERDAVKSGALVAAALDLMFTTPVPGEA